MRISIVAWRGGISTLREHQISPREANATEHQRTALSLFAIEAWPVRNRRQPDMINPKTTRAIARLASFTTVQLDEVLWEFANFYYKMMIVDYPDREGYSN